MQKKMKTLVTASIALSTATIASSILLSNQLLYKKKKEEAFIIERETKARRIDLNAYKKLNTEAFQLPSKEGYFIHGEFIQFAHITRTIILCHGVTESKTNMLKYIPMYERLGYNVVLYDQRRHGLTGGRTTSYGFYEKWDLHIVVQYVREKMGHDAIVGIHGESMGAATLLLYSALPEAAANFYISDCSFSTFKEQFAHVLKHMPLPIAPTLSLTNVALKIRHRFSFKDIAPLSIIDQVTAPILFIHSVEDSFIPYEMTEQLFMKKRGAKQLKIFEKGKHAQAFNTQPAEYEKIVRQFVLRYFPQHKKKLSLQM